MAIPVLGQQITGGRASLVIEGVVAAYSNNAGYSHNWNFESFVSLGSIETIENVITSYGGSVTCSGIELASTNLTTLNIQPQMGNSAQEHLSNILAQKPFVITFEDTVTGIVNATCLGCRLTGSNKGFPSQQMSTTDYTFVCTRILEYGQAA